MKVKDPNIDVNMRKISLKDVYPLNFIIRVVQTKQNQEKVADYLHEVDKPLARYRDDKDLEEMLKDQEREDDPMLAYMKQKKRKQDIKEGKKGLIFSVEH